MPQLAARYGLHPTQINSWKRLVIDQASELFCRNNNVSKGSRQTTDDLHRVIGQLTVEQCDFLARKLYH
ncbi:hypothetical protein [Nitrosomonas sp. Nm33]|uniref:hypothetical protein n=1 Tax=Nitrosomonas sp. Nm33 TaxID=133724 RepID=UPI000B82B466|nr:hypothetical protein [Nitrosomonas sp. Nm33]